MCTCQCMVRSRNIYIRYIYITTFVTRIKQLTWLESFAWGYYQWVHLHNLGIKCVLGRLQILCGCVLDCVWLYILWWGLFLLCIWVCFLCFFPLIVSVLVSSSVVSLCLAPAGAWSPVFLGFVSCGFLLVGVVAEIGCLFVVFSGVCSRHSV